MVTAVTVAGEQGDARSVPGIRLHFVLKAALWTRCSHCPPFIDVKENCHHFARVTQPGFERSSLVEIVCCSCYLSGEE